MSTALRLLADGRGDAVVSTGNTGALFTGATLIVRKIKGVRRAVDENGLLGAFMGGFTSAAVGVSAAIFFGLLAALVFKSGSKINEASS